MVDTSLLIDINLSESLATAFLRSLVTGLDSERLIFLPVSLQVSQASRGDRAIHWHRRPGFLG